MKLNDLRTLGRSGLAVSPLCLGTMTVGRADWGSPDEVSREIFNAYLDAGGNFIDTANVYGDGRSEELVGRFIAERKLRDRLVLATKYSFNDDYSDTESPLFAGNSRKNVYRALEASLSRLETDYVDLYWMHVWDRVTPAEEVVQSLGDLVRAGRIRYYGFSDMPAWYTAKAATLAQALGVPGPIAMQMQYSLIERSIELEFVPAAREFGMGITPWSPLAFGFLAGKYSRDASGNVTEAGGRLDPSKKTMFGGPVPERNWTILDALREVAKDVDRSLAQVALAWVVGAPGVTSTIIGASKTEQLHDNLAALDVVLTGAQREKLDSAGSPPATFPYSMFSKDRMRGVFGGSSVESWDEQR